MLDEIVKGAVEGFIRGILSRGEAQKRIRRSRSNPAVSS